MLSHTLTSRSQKSKNPRGHDEDSGGETVTPRNPSKPQSSNTLAAPARQIREPLLSSDRNDLQKPTLQKTPMKLFVQPERETDDEYENEADNDFRPSFQQPFQPAHHGMEENPFVEDENVFTSDYQSDLKPSRRHTFLEEK